jgi:predicted NBD/HSP70 family sugar kinase
MDTQTARPQMLKQANLSAIRRVIKERCTATRTEIARETRISSTTVRSLLTEMQQNGEIESIGYDESSGGRKAERYRIAMDRYFGVVFCLINRAVYYFVVNICGEIVETGRLDTKKGTKAAMICFLDYLTALKEIRAIGLGVPGIVEGGSYLRKNPGSGIKKIDIGNDLSQKYGIPVVMENDLNAIAIGSSRCYQKQGDEKKSWAYVYFDKGCIGAGFISEGGIIRGFNNCAGELGMLPSEGGEALAESITKTANNIRYSMYVSRIVCWICGILNPQYIVLGGPDFRRECLDTIRKNVSSLLPKEMHAEIAYSPHYWREYYEGMAYLTASRIFDEVQITVD